MDIGNFTTQVYEWVKIQTHPQGLPWQNRLKALREKIRWSCGAGLVLLLGIARLELNYCLPFGAQTSDSLNHGIQVGVGINFL
ncbi:Sorting and assembly machinery component 50-like protein A [Acropora cervicornis]|uniref:Sorting and assembly machinery component 50-like protein A n=1 Tax=Acropora cervicornis TaxID=6130 RepID=A0AAD9QWZ7_ACRCE|nr:Sorting and assembly machinery component 50-like protein A [Acropora cervicornis]